MLSKPLRRKNEVAMDATIQSGQVKVESQRYKTRVTRTNAGQVCLSYPSPIRLLFLIIIDDDYQHITVDAIAADGKVITYSGRTVDVAGRQATLSIDGDIRNSNIQSMETIGRDKQSSAESTKSRLMLSALQGTINLESYPFVSEIYLKTIPAWENAPSLASAPELYYPSKTPLNESQARAVEAILAQDNTKRVVVVQGPPGTGKTTVIAAAVTSIMSSSDNDEDQNRTVWLVAQSNVAVKNIAEKLASVDFLDFKILVAKDFHFDWSAVFVSGEFKFTNRCTVGMNTSTKRLRQTSFAQTTLTPTSLLQKGSC